jgi:hypothetical protein
VRSPVQSYTRLYRCVLTDLPSLFRRQRLVEILNSGQYASPIIVFVNQKKTADQVAKDLQRAQVMTSFFSTVPLQLSLTTVSVERCYAALWQEPGTARGGSPVIARRQSGCAGCHRPCRTWYRRAGRLARYQLPDGKYNRSIRPPYWYDCFVHMAVVSANGTDASFFLLSPRSYGSCGETGHSNHVPHER